MIARRGVWTWGYVVYDYRRFLEAMVKLKMNWWIVWDRVNALWSRYYLLATRLYREMVAACPAGVMAAGLIEDGMLEARIQPAVALFAEMLWNPDREDHEILRSALESCLKLGS